MTDKTRINKLKRNEFMRWLINNYGYSRDDIPATINARMLSDKYKKSTGEYISRVSIYRWLKNFDKFISDEYNAEYNNYCNN